MIVHSHVFVWMVHQYDLFDPKFWVIGVGLRCMLFLVNPINPTCPATLGVLLPHAPLVPRGSNQLKGLQRQDGFDKKSYSDIPFWSMLGLSMNWLVEMCDSQGFQCPQLARNAHFNDCLQTLLHRQVVVLVSENSQRGLTSECWKHWIICPTIWCVIFQNSMTPHGKIRPNFLAYCSSISLKLG